MEGEGLLSLKIWDLLISCREMPRVEQHILKTHLFILFNVRRGREMLEMKISV